MVMFNSFFHVLPGRVYPVVPAGWNVTIIQVGHWTSPKPDPFGKYESTATFFCTCMYDIYIVYTYGIIWIGLKNPEILVFTPKIS